ncbi:hypothetical protein B0J14DRAFT_587353 [Halenospora varia]|nr:hypothetical protein B0J14DRAFT_587353 [Halenospora varia]
MSHSFPASALFFASPLILSLFSLFLLSAASCTCSTLSLFLCSRFEAPASNFSANVLAFLFCSAFVAPFMSSPFGVEVDEVVWILGMYSSISDSDCEESESEEVSEEVWKNFDVGFEIVLEELVGVVVRNLDAMIAFSCGCEDKQDFGKSRLCF